MSKQRNWERVRQNNLLEKAKRSEFERKWKQKRKYSTYRNGNFHIGNRMIEKWRLNRGTRHPGDGIFFNQASGDFEVWHGEKRISNINWRSNWQELIWWAHRHGWSSD